MYLAREYMVQTQRTIFAAAGHHKTPRVILQKALTYKLLLLGMYIYITEVRRGKER